MVKYHYALGADDRLIPIDEVTKGNRAKQYTCLGCGGEMEAVLGDKREHHFRHKDDACHRESYLHKLGKRRLRERFYSQEEFIIQYSINYSCDKAETCEFCSKNRDFQCNRQETSTIDLKKQYDTCEEEVVYGNYRADLMLSSKEHPERKPVFLEIHVTNECSTEKRESGIQIIEIDVKEEKDVESLIVESPSIRFYGFEKERKAVRRLSRFCVTRDNKDILRFYTISDDLTCHNVEGNHRDGSIYEVAIQTEDFGNKVERIFEIGLVKAGRAGFHFKCCCLCSFYRKCLKAKQSEDKFVLAQKCKFFHKGLDWGRLDHLWHNYLCHEWKNSEI